MSSIDDYCTLDDSTRPVWGKRVKTPKSYSERRVLLPGMDFKTIETYVSSIFTPDLNQFSRLIFVKPMYAEIDEGLLVNFVEEVVGEKELISCPHYKQYPSIEGMDSVVFPTKMERSQRDYDAIKRSCFNKADVDARVISKQVRGSLMSFPNWNNFMKAVLDEEEKIFLDGFLVHISGFKE